MNYENISDFEIAKAVLKIKGIECKISGGMCFTKHVRNVFVKFDPCNKPNDAWPIIVENGISLKFMDAKIKYYEAHGLNKNTSDEDWHSIHPNPLRAAMICFLKMKEY